MGMTGEEVKLQLSTCPLFSLLSDFCYQPFLWLLETFLNSRKLVKKAFSLWFHFLKFANKTVLTGFLISFHSVFSHQSTHIQPAWKWKWRTHITWHGSRTNPSRPRLGIDTCIALSSAVTWYRVIVYCSGKNMFKLKSCHMKKLTQSYRMIEDVT